MENEIIFGSLIVKLLTILEIKEFNVSNSINAMPNNNKITLTLFSIIDYCLMVNLLCCKFG